MVSRPRRHSRRWPRFRLTPLPPLRPHAELIRAIGQRASSSAAASGQPRLPAHQATAAAEAGRTSNRLHLSRPPLPPRCTNTPGAAGLYSRRSAAAARLSALLPAAAHAAAGLCSLTRFIRAPLAWPPPGYPSAYPSSLRSALSAAGRRLPAELSARSIRRPTPMAIRSRHRRRRLQKLTAVAMLPVIRRRYGAHQHAPMPPQPMPAQPERRRPSRAWRHRRRRRADARATHRSTGGGGSRRAGATTCDAVGHLRGPSPRARHRSRRGGRRHDIRGTRAKIGRLGRGSIGTDAAAGGRPCP